MVKDWATKWRTVQIPEEYYRQISDYVKKRAGYASISEYVREAIRDKLKADLGGGNDRYAEAGERGEQEPRPGKIGGSFKAGRSFRTRALKRNVSRL